MTVVQSPDNWVGISGRTKVLAAQIVAAAERFGLEVHLSLPPSVLLQRSDGAQLAIRLRAGRIHHTVPCWIPDVQHPRAVGWDDNIHPVDWATAVIARFALNQLPERVGVLDDYGHPPQPWQDVQTMWRPANPSHNQSEVSESAYQDQEQVSEGNATSPVTALAITNIETRRDILPRAEIVFRVVAHVEDLAFLDGDMDRIQRDIAAALAERFRQDLLHTWNLSSFVPANEPHL